MTASALLNFRLTSKAGTEEREIEIKNLVIAGWTGRDAEATEAHIAELEAIGVARPKRTPCFYRASAGQLTTKDAIQVIGGESSGEAEFFQLALDDGLWIGVGSDHTDRKVETYDVAVSKQMCAKPVAAELWRFDEIADHWDEIELGSTIVTNGRRETYQAGNVAAMRPPPELIALYAPETEKLAPGTLMFCGTLAVIGGVRPADAFEVRLHDPVLERTITNRYDIQTLPREE